MKPGDIILFATPHGESMGEEFGLTLLFRPEDSTDLALALLGGESLFENDRTGELFLSDTDGIEEQEIGLVPIRLPPDIRRAILSGALGWPIDSMTTSDERYCYEAAAGKSGHI